MFKMTLAAFLFASACAHDSKEKEIFRQFPKHFLATQSIRVATKNGQDVLLAKLSRNNQDIKVVFLEPLFSQAILTQESTTKGITTKWHKEIALPFDASQIMNLIRAIYMHERYMLKDDYYFLDLPDAKISFSQVAAPCAFPKKMEVDFKANPSVKLSITTEDVACPS